MHYHLFKYSHFTDHTHINSSSSDCKKHEKKQILFTSLSTILFLLLFVSCTRNKVEQLSILNHVIKSDTIFEKNTFFLGNNNNGLVDMKFINDSVLLFSIIRENSNCYLKTYLINDSIETMDERKLSEELSKIISEGNCSNIFMINPDSLIISSDLAFYFYSFVSDTIYKTIISDPNSYFSSLYTNIFYDQPNGDIYTYYSDGSANYMNDIQSKKKIIRYAKINENNFDIKKITVSMNDTVIPYNINLQHHFVYANGLFINKSSYNNGFETYNPKTKEYDYIDFSFLKKTNDNTEFHNNNKRSYQNLKKHYMDSYIQQSLMYDYETQKMVLLYLNPVPERDENGLMPEFCFRKKNLYMFNQDFKPLGYIETKEDCFIPSYSFAINGKIHMLRISQHKITLNTIEYELQ